MSADQNIQRTPHEKFLRTVEEETYQHDRHRIKTRLSAGAYRAVCSCAWISAAHETHAEAVRAGQEHQRA